MLRNLFRSRRDREPPQPQVFGRPARIPDGICVYAVGDLHGRRDLLAELHEQIAHDAARLPPDAERIVVYVGDYVDRGLESRGVIDHLLDRPLRGFRAIHLLGNHDAWLLGFLDDASLGPNWFRFGGDATLLSYGVRQSVLPTEPEPLEELRRELRARVPARHRAFLERLRLTSVIGDYLFVHAGVRPGVPLDQQQPEDLIWIREPFLKWQGNIGKVVVHGHTVHTEPEVRANRIAIDTGACWTGRLTALVLEGGAQRFLTTGAEPVAGAARTA
ncbi:MAG TPA: metallophosphoesterase family protein [Geminicoccaceae bacterium]|nr:metallophosphoesterase family protein [Geminicoccaceae bacterium]